MGRQKNDAVVDEWSAEVPTPDGPMKFDYQIRVSKIRRKHRIRIACEYRGVEEFYYSYEDAAPPLETLREYVEVHGLRARATAKLLGLLFPELRANNDPMSLNFEALSP